MRLRSILLLLPLLLLLLVAGSWRWLLHSQPGARWIWAQAVSATDGALAAERVAGNLASGLTVEGFAFNGEGITVSAAEILFSIQVDLLPKIVTVNSAHVTELEILRGGMEPVDKKSTDIREVLASLQLPVHIVLTGLRLDDSSLRGFAGDKHIDIASAFLAGSWKDAIRVDRLEFVMPGIEADANGRLLLDRRNDLRLNLHALTLPELTGLGEPVRIEVNLAGPLHELAVHAQTDVPGATLHGRVTGIADEPAWDLLLEVPDFRVPPSIDVPEFPPLRITANGAGDLRTFKVDAQIDFVGTDMAVTAKAEGAFQAETLSGSLAWQSLQWPVRAENPRVASKTGSVTLAGSLDDWSVTGTVELEVPRLPAGRFTIAGTGDRDQAAVEIIDGNVLGGTIAGSAEYRWRGRQDYLATLDLKNVHTSALLPEWPAVLSGRAEVKGRQQPLELSVTLGDIAGRLRDKPLRAGGRFDVREKVVSADALWVEHGETRIDVDGQPYAKEGLRYEVSIDDLGHYLESSSGSLMASGSLSLRKDHPYLRIDASGEQIKYDKLQVSGLTIRNRGEFNNILDVEVLADTVTYADIRVDNVRLQTAVAEQSQALDLDLTIEGLAAGVSVVGTLDDWQRPDSWSGQISRLDLDHEKFSASLAEPSGVVFGREQVVAEPLCIRDARGIELCADGSWQPGPSFEINASFLSVPANLVNAFVDTRLSFDQLVSGDLRWQNATAGTSTGRADIKIAPGTIVSVDHSDLKITTAEGTVSFDVNDNSLRSGRFSLPIPELGQLAAEFEVLDVAGGGAPLVNGRVDVDLADIRPIEVLLPIIDDVSGSLSAKLEIAGTLDSPEIVGDIVLRNGTLRYLPVGLKLRELELRSNLRRSGDIVMSGTFRAGEGIAHIQTRSDYSSTAARGLEVILLGENLTLIDVPDLSAVANTDVGIHFDGKNLDVDGRIEIPRARIRPANLAMNRISESDDVIIVAGELPDQETVPDDDTELQMHGSLEVALGNDVVIELDLAEANLTGSTVFTWSGDPMPNANGRYNINGEILAFGQLLEIAEGSVRFAGGPANDPYLRLSAEREIYGNTQVRRAGVLVAGSTQSPTFEAYTTPQTTEERALTLLVTGSDFDYEKGIGALDFGTYVAPRVYASYGIGLFDNENVVRIRYDLNRGFGITGTSGQQDSGADLSYRFEN